jgi:uncharacterized protein
VPHFEKMLYDNAGLLGNYVHAFQTFVEPEFAETARDILRWMDEWLSDRERGGFYASQDADISLDDDGDYFTWTREEAAAALTAEEMAVAEAYYDIGELGEMHHNPKKNVLHRNYTVEQVAARVKRGTGRPGEPLRDSAAGDPGGTKALVESVKRKLYAERLRRPTPFIDKTIYTSWNAMAVSAYLDAARVLDLESARRFALKTLERIWLEGWTEEAGLAHVIAYPDATERDQPGAARRVAGVLDDYALLAHACVDAWEATGERRWYDRAMELAERMVARFYDAEGGGFFDTAQEGGVQLGALAARRKPTQDSPTPAGNGTAAAALLRLEALNGRKDFRGKAEATLASFAGVIEHYGLYAGSYGLALQRLLLPPIQVAVVGDGDATRRLAAMATARYAVNKAVIALRPQQVTAEALPPVLAGTLPHLPDLGRKAVALVCRGTSCLPPAGTGEELVEQINSAI